MRMSDWSSDVCSSDLKNLLAGTTCVAHHDPWHAALDESNFPVGLLRDYGWSYALGWPDYGPPVQQSFAATPPDRPWLLTPEERRVGEEGVSTGSTRGSLLH